MFSVVHTIGKFGSPSHSPRWVLLSARISALQLPPSVKLPQRYYSGRAQSKESSALAESKAGGSEISTATAFETVKETTKTAGNLGVILFGLGITGSILYAVCQELFSGNSPNNIYSDALDKCIKDQRIRDHLGEPIKAYGEENARGRRRHVSHSVYEVSGQKHMFLKFYIQGSRKKGTVYVEMKADDKGNFQRNILAVELDDLLRTKIVLENNRETEVPSSESLPTLF